MDTKIGVEMRVDCKELDEAIAKANQLVKLLREVQQIIGSLSREGKLET